MKVECIKDRIINNAVELINLNTDAVEKITLQMLETIFWKASHL